MAIIRFRNKEDLEEWKRVVANFESMVALANQESEILKKFCESQLQSAQFWKRYAFERTNDAKLREIAVNGLKQVEIDTVLVDSAVPTFLEKLSKYLKECQLEN